MPCQARRQTPPDVLLQNEGSIIVFRPQNDKAQEWLEANTDGMWFGGGFVVEHRYAGDLARGMIQEGFGVK